MVVMIHIVNFSTLYPQVKDFINFFFMQAFLLITGYLVNIRKAYKEFAVYVVKIMIPYIIMVTGYAFLSTLLPVRDGVSEFTIPVILHTIFVTSIGPYWFLYTMVICGVIYYFVFNTFSKIGTAGKLCLFATLLIIVPQYTPLLQAPHAAFYFGGVCLRLTEKRLDEVIKPSWWSVLPFVAIACLPNYRNYNFLAMTILALSFLSFIPKLIQSIGNGNVLRIIGYIGRNTLPIYLFHPIFTMGGKFALPLFRFDPSGVTHIVFTVIAGVVGSLAIAAFLDKCHLSYLLARKKFLR